ncbi:predicted protein [Nematostella vectensis]|uniref:Peptidase S9 prolyl oligopeptidase catalytic domain-containing protein n=1 Tax=Nematostella vectensis TaxID=45351 RepID=A7RWV1_NEMVE|nr:predicted protein [Nematostella vectensis]|eukprot:XP_001636103.1 predicted protein [Nematostella vectensis]
MASTTKNTAPYGSWISPITSDLVIKEAIGLSEVRVDPFEPGVVYWSESHPEEGGRITICKLQDNGSKFEEIIPKEFNCRTRVHEYGGGAFLVHKKQVYFSNFGDQRIYKQDAVPGATPVAITPDGKGWRYADATVTHTGRHLLCVREDHGVLETGASEALATIVSIDLKTQEQHVLVSGCNFYSSPRISKHGMLAWVQWNHPNMPWDDTELWIGKLNSTGDALEKNTIKKVSGGVGISVMLPKWTPDDKLLYINDKTNWWNLYRLEDDGSETNLCPQNSEIGVPQWTFGGSDYECDVKNRGEILVTFNHALSILKTTGQLVPLDTGGNLHSHVHMSPDGKSTYLLVGSPTKFPTLIRMDMKTKAVTVLREAARVGVDPGYYSIPQEITYPTADNLVSHGYFYPPKNKDYAAPEGALPPLLVKVHGGPTSATNPCLDLEVQYFTSRGIGILDVNYRGSTSYGREFRNQLRQNWGIADVDDCCNGALYLANKGEADIKRLAIDGGSAGGYTTLSALTFKSVFGAGASMYGISDVETLAKETHKFESHYVDILIGPYPESRDVYIARSPIYHLDGFNCALVIFQGDEDEVVPPNQAQMMFDAVNAKGLPVAMRMYEGEQHGFRKAENIKDCLESELYFYSKIFGFYAPGLTVELKIYNL